MRSAAHFRSHPIHPIFVSFPIALFTGALLADVVAAAAGMYSLHAVSYYLCWGGLAGGLLAAVPGFIDFTRTVPPQSSASKRAIKHALINVSVLVLFAVVILMRREGFSNTVFIPEGLAVGMMFYSGSLGATLVHRNQIGVDHRYANAGKWKELTVRNPVFPLEVAGTEELKTDQMKLLRIGDRRLVLARTEKGYAVFDDRCTHRGGSLAGGVTMKCVVHCPWHGSQYDVFSGECLAGPAEKGIQVYPVVERDKKVLLMNL